MRKFRFVGDPNTYGWDEPPVCGKIYPEDYLGESDGIKYNMPSWLVSPEDWQEVIEPLHKDTDLGYFAGLVIQSLISDKEMSVKIASELAIETAKELIKRLENETNRH
jgi:hypothetical protein